MHCLSFRGVKIYTIALEIFPFLREAIDNKSEVDFCHFNSLSFLMCPYPL